MNPCSIRTYMDSCSKYDCVELDPEMMSRFANLIAAVCLTQTHNGLTRRGDTVYQRHKIDRSHVEYSELVRLLRILYIEKELGIKTLCRLLSEQGVAMTYTPCRRVVQSLLGPDFRRGRSQVTETLKLIRSENAKKTTPWRDWPRKYPTKNINSKKYLGGYFFNTSKTKWVYLRSSWEYAYAAYLESRGSTWDVECQSYLLGNGSYYRPDFFIYVDNKLDHIVEIKSTYFNGSLNRLEKFQMFQSEYPNIRSEVVLNNELFMMIGKSPNRVLQEWKSVRRMSDDVR